MIYRNFGILLFAALILFSCRSKQLEITGTVTSALSGKPISACVIAYVDKKNHHSYHMTRTDSSGNFKLLNLNRKISTRNIFVLAAKYGYTEKFIKISGRVHLDAVLEPVKINYSEKIRPGIELSGKNEICLFELSSDKVIPTLKFKREKSRVVRTRYPSRNKPYARNTLYSIENDFLQLDSLISSMQSGSYFGVFSDDFNSGLSCILNSEKSICSRGCSMIAEGKYADEFNTIDELLIKMVK